MRAHHNFIVRPRLPAPLAPLGALALNLYWPRYYETAELFRCLSPELWEECGHNPVLFLRRLPQERLNAAAQDPYYIESLTQIYDPSWAAAHGLDGDTVIAYFSAEFGLNEALPIYAGGLGVLAGDHLKSASDLTLPLVGVGLLYRHGNFRQRLDSKDCQQEVYPFYDFYELPLELERDGDGNPLTVPVAFPEREVRVKIWKARVGRLHLYLLDSDCPENWETDRSITDTLYGGDLEKRIQQEILLGIGGMRALAALKLEPSVYHLNEGHSAFLVLEHIRRLQEKHGLDFATAFELAKASHIFTTHTPVAAGIDLFPPYLMDKYFTAYYQSLGLSRHEFLALGRQDPNNQQEPFNMAVLALRLSSWANGVSRLHGQTARKMWQSVWPNLPAEEVPISHVTNGVHITSWVGEAMLKLFDRYLGPSWRENQAKEETWAPVAKIPDWELWQGREKQRHALIKFAREKLARQLLNRGAALKDIEEARAALDPEALTIGFARRFAAYKRPALLFHDGERLKQILSDSRRPVQIIFAGKAHPQDEEGKKLINYILTQSRREEFKGKIIFLEDYDLNIARYLLQGVDLWLASPRRPLEACSTSGMKAVLNGALHISTLDGWWDEAWEPETGWAIGRGEVYEDPLYQDAVEAELLYDLLERDIIPLYYERDARGLPSGWLARVKKSIQAYAPVFNSRRMVEEYAGKFYLPAARLYRRLHENDQQRARELARWKKGVEDSWSQVRIEKVEGMGTENLEVGDNLSIRAIISLGPLKPEDVRVAVYYGPVDGKGEIIAGEKLFLPSCEDLGGGRYLYTASLPCRCSGRQGYSLCVFPYHEDMGQPYATGLILWG
ncbi:alpha-glucan family phosphorylase [Neomoorella humiferrea]|uniref:alpha-glucan family phosphorylase n=1 Tax=Neomoorella humiferrea TaxID=676965 RepID=UPI003D8A449C